MAQKKRRKFHNESPFTAEEVAAITKELPHVLVKEGYLKAQEPKKNLEPKSAEKIAEPIPVPITVTRAPKIVPRGDRRALWYTVFFFSLFIFSIWLFNARTIMSDIWGTHSSQALVDQSKDDLGSILETIKQNDKIFQDRLNESDKAKAAVEEALKSINKNPR